MTRQALQRFRREILACKNIRTWPLLLHGDDIEKAKAVIRALLNEDERVLQDPEPLVVVSGLGDSSVNLTVRVWGNSADLWPIFWSMQEKVKARFDAEGITIPYPQRDVHLHQV